MEAKEVVLNLSMNSEEIAKQIDICNAKAKELIQSIEKLNGMKIHIEVDESGFQMKK